MQQNNIIYSRATPTNIPKVTNDILQAPRLCVYKKLIDIIVTYTNKEAERAFDQKRKLGIDEDEHSEK